jgi:hypothetical protein
VRSIYTPSLILCPTLVTALHKIYSAHLLMIIITTDVHHRRKISPSTYPPHSKFYQAKDERTHSRHVELFSSKLCAAGQQKHTSRVDDVTFSPGGGPQKHTTSSFQSPCFSGPKGVSMCEEETDYRGYDGALYTATRQPTH